jgi:carbon-monoxide dehydrogenase large subunit
MAEAVTDPALLTPDRPIVIGTRAAKLRGDLFLTGQAQYLDDIALPRMAHLAVLRSAHAHALIRGVDASAAREQPGVIAAITGDEAALLTDPIPHRMDPARLEAKLTQPRCLAVGKVIYAGQPVAAVVGETRADAEAALASIVVDYEPLPCVLDVDEAVAEGAPLIHADWGDNVFLTSAFVEGDVDAALAEADHTLEDEVRIQRYSSQPIETRGYIASWDSRDGSFLLHATSQHPHQLRWQIAQALRVDEQKIRVIVPELGGGFGLKLCGHPEETLVCLASRVVKRPVKWIEGRGECLLIGAREQVHRFSVGFRDDGTIVALRDHFMTNVGAIGPASGWAMSFLTALCFPSGYKIPNTDVRVSAVTTNKGTWNASRGYGKEATTLVMERIVDLVARRVDIDPAEVRRRNFIRSDEFPYRTNSGLNIDSGDYHAALDSALELVGYDSLRAEQQRLRGTGRYLGIGIAFELTPEAADIPGALVGGYDTATVRVDPSGGVLVLTGITNSGGGNDTGIAQIVAHELGVRPESITVLQGDTTMCPYGFGNSSGRSIVTGGGAATLAARDIRAKLELVAAELLETTPGALRLAEGEITDTASGRSLSLREVAFAIYANAFGVARVVDPPLESTRVYKPDNITHVPDAKGRIQPYPTYSNAVHVALVEVDSETGKVDLRRLGCVHDCGTMINPTLVEGQMHGAMVMGAGAALSEQIVYDDQGRPLVDQFKNYLLLRASDLPNLELVHQVTPSPFTVLGAKGAGEAGVGGAQAAIANAVDDALVPLGATVRRLPLSAPTVLKLIRDAALAR